MNLFLKELEHREYNHFVINHPSGSFLQSAEWGKWQESLGKQIFRFCVTDETNNVLLAAQVIKTKLPKVNKYYLYIPYGPLSKENTPEVLNFFIEELAKKFPGNIFVRIEPKDELSLQPTTYNIQPTPHIQPGKTLILDLSKSEEELLADMHHKTRYNIKVAQKHGVQIVSELIVTPRHGLHMKEVAELLTQTARRQKYKDQGAGYYKKMIDFFGMDAESQLRLTVYKALYNQKLLACAVMIDFGETRTYLFGGTANEHKNVMAAYLLHWQAIIDAKKANQKFYDFWGIETAKGKTPGFVRFKIGFGGKEVAYPKACDVITNKPWYNIYKSIRFVNSKLNKFI